MKHESDPFDQIIAGMSSFDTVNSIGRSPNYDEQSLMLAEVQSKHLDDLRKSGYSTYEHILAGLNIEQGEQPKVHVVQKLDRHIPGAYTISYMLTNPSEDGKGRSFEYAKIGVVDQGGLILSVEEGFSEPELEMALSQMNELNELKKEGVLPDFKEYRGDIFNRATAMQQSTPKVDEL